MRAMANNESQVTPLKHACTRHHSIIKIKDTVLVERDSIRSMLAGRFREVHVATFSVKDANEKLLPEDISQEIIIWGMVYRRRKCPRVCMGPKTKLHY